MTATRSTRPPVGRVAVYVISIVSVILGVGLTILPGTPVEAATCDYLGSSCSGGSISGGSATIWATQTSAGSTSSTSGSSGSATASSGANKVSSSTQTLSKMCTVLGNRSILCSRLAPQTVARSVPQASTVATIPGLTLSDLAGFSPAQPSLLTEPAGWTVLGAETNMYVTTGQHTVTGVLLGRPIEVRFTPVDFDWAFGDGVTNRGAAAGGSWQGLGLSEFSHTATSHVYGQLGSFAPQVTVGFQVEYRWGGLGWITVSGRASKLASAGLVAVVPAHTVLLTGPCQAGASSIGC